MYRFDYKIFNNAHTKEFNIAKRSIWPPKSLPFMFISVSLSLPHSSSTAITVGLQPLISTFRERDTFLVCVQITSGSLERNVVVGLEAENNTAIRKSYNNYIAKSEGSGRISSDSLPIFHTYIS